MRDDVPLSHWLWSIANPGAHSYPVLSSHFQWSCKTKIPEFPFQKSCSWWRQFGLSPFSSQANICGHQVTRVTGFRNEFAGSRQSYATLTFSYLKSRIEIMGSPNFGKAPGNQMVFSSLASFRAHWNCRKFSRKPRGIPHSHVTCTKCTNASVTQKKNSAQPRNWLVSLAIISPWFMAYQVCN